MTSLYANIGGSRKTISSAFGNISGGSKVIYQNKVTVYEYAMKRKSVISLGSLVSNTGGSGSTPTMPEVYVGTGVSSYGNTYNLTGYTSITSQDDMNNFCIDCVEERKDFYSMCGPKTFDILTHNWPSIEDSWLREHVLLYIQIYYNYLDKKSVFKDHLYEEFYVNVFSNGIHISMNNHFSDSGCRYGAIFEYYDSSYDTLWSTFEADPGYYYTGMTNCDYRYVVE